uniref:tyrosine-type recombinase/integrase n=1 Tax=Pseudomonas sp. NBRC 111143 TaxID=1661058 RepID=UPI0012E195FC
KTRSVYISRNLMSELYRYVLKVRGERAHLSKTSQRALFLNREGNAFGEDGKSLNRIISNIGKNAGMKVHTHMLRHTYATLTLLSLQRDPLCGVDPLVFLQRQLGHTSLNTTMMYLHLVNEMADDAVLAYDDELIALGKPDDQAQDLP